MENCVSVLLEVMVQLIGVFGSGPLEFLVFDDVCKGQRNIKTHLCC